MKPQEICKKKIFIPNKIIINESEYKIEFYKLCEIMKKVFIIFGVRCNKLMPLHTQQQAKNGRGGGDNLDRFRVAIPSHVGRGEYNVNKGFLN